MAAPKVTSNSNASSVPRLPPVVLKDYAVTEKLGEGSYGSVYKAHGKTGAREVVAVKCVLKSQLSAPERDNLITEISLLKKLRHDHIVSLVDFCHDANYIYIITEYCGGGDLSRFIKRRDSLPEDVCKRFLRQLAAALKFMRDQDISHMDLKPSNILLTAGRKPQLKLADFGLAQKFSSDETKSSVRGSYLYMAPEILLKQQYDNKIDLWSIGVILYECLFGKAPYKSQSIQELLLKVKEEKPIVVPRQANLSKNCRDLLVRCLERDPKKRITFEEFFSHPFLDLEHIPTETSFKQAASLAKQAVDKDNQGDVQAALALYKESLAYYEPLLKEETNSSRREAISNRIHQYLRRAEELKAFLSADCSVETLSSALSRDMSLEEPHLRQQSSVESARLDDLRRMSAGTPKLLTALEIAQTAEEYEAEGRYQVALDKYEMALGMLMPVLRAEPKGERKRALGVEVRRWMQRAESVKQFVETQEKVLADAAASRMAEDPCEGSVFRDKQCIVQ